MNIQVEFVEWGGGSAEAPLPRPGHRQPGLRVVRPPGDSEWRAGSAPPGGGPGHSAAAACSALEAAATASLHLDSWYPMKSYMIY